MKYRKGDRIHVYGGIAGVDSQELQEHCPARATVLAVDEDGCLLVDFHRVIDCCSTWRVHPKQCRKLKPKPLKSEI